MVAAANDDDDADEDVDKVACIDVTNDPPPPPVAVLETGYAVTVGPLMKQVPLMPIRWNRAHRDIFGRSTAQEAGMDRRIRELEEAIRDLDPTQSQSLMTAINEFPLLIVSCAHTRMILEAEDFEPRAAARKLARYWNARERSLGVEAFAQGNVAEPTLQDHLEFYRLSENILEDRDASDQAKLVPQLYLESVNRAKIAALDRIIAQMPTQETEELLDARAHAPELADTDEHKLLYLRCFSLIEVVAAEMMAAYWKKKYELFGRDVAIRRVTLDDSEGMFVTLNVGSFQVMPNTDSFGRVILCMTGFLPLLDCDQLGVDQCFWYVYSLALEMGAGQKGAIMIGDMRDIFTLARIIAMFRILRSIRGIRACQPFEYKAVHVILPRNGLFWQQFIPLFISFASIIVPIERFVLHCRSNDELISILGGKYGIPADRLPSKWGGGVTLENWRAFLEERKANGK